MAKVYSQTDNALLFWSIEVLLNIMKNTLSNKINIKSTNANILKFLAAILVIVCHSYPITGNGVDMLARYTNGECNFGGFAVGIFFFYSGLYVTKSLSKTNSTSSYIKKRITRIFPQLIIVVLLSAFILGPITTTYLPGNYFQDKNTYLYLLNAIMLPIHNLPGVFENAPYSAVNGALWTLPVEFACYIMLAVILILTCIFARNSKYDKKGDAVNSKAFQNLLLIVLFGIILLFIAIYFIIKNDFMLSVVRPVILFIVGSIFYEYREKITLNKWGGAIALVGLVISGYIGLFSIGMLVFLPYSVLAFTLGIAQIDIDWKIFKISYEMYLLGWPIQQTVFWIFNDNMPAFLNVFITLAFDIVLGYILFVIIEKIEKHGRHVKQDKQDEQKNKPHESLKEEKLSMKKSVMWNTFGSFFYYFCQWIMTVLVVRISGIDDAGILTLCISVSNIWMSLSSFGMHNYQASDTKNKYSFNTYLVSRYITGIVSFLGCVIYILLISYSMKQNICILFYFLYRFSESLEDVYYAAFQKSWHIDIAGKSMIIRGVVSLALFIGILSASKNLSITIAAMAIACTLIVYAYDTVKFKKNGLIIENGNERANKKIVLALIIECAPLAIFTLLNAFIPMAPRLIMEKILGNYKLGIYGSVATPTVIVQMIATYVFNPFVTLFAEELENNNIKKFRKTFGKVAMYLGIISVIFIAGGLLLGRIGLQILYGAEVAKHTYLLIPLIISSILIAFSWLFGGVLTAQRKFKWLIFGNLLSVATVIPLAYFMELKYDMQGASYAMIMSMGLTVIVMIIGLTLEISKLGKTNRSESE